MIKNIIYKMKAILVLCLLASISCFNIINAGICLVGNEKVRTIASEAISSIKEKDFDKILRIIISNFSELKDIVSKCLKDENDDIKLKAIRCPPYCCGHNTMCNFCKCY